MAPAVQTRYSGDLISAEVQLLNVALNGSVKSHFPKFIVLSDSALPAQFFAEVCRAWSGEDWSDICVPPEKVVKL